MWKIFEHRRVSKQLIALPQEVLKRYEKWKDIVAISGPDGLKQIKGFRDEHSASCDLQNRKGSGAGAGCECHTT